MFAVFSDGSAPCLSTESGELQLAKLRLLHFFAAPPTQAKDAETAQPYPEKNAPPVFIGLSGRETGKTG
jgi:hypothetical protein